MEKIYFVESIKQVNENYATVLLLYIPQNIDRWINTNKDFKWFIRENIDINSSENIKEGEFVYGIKGQYLSANNDSRVIKIVTRYSQLVENLRNHRIDRPNILYENIKVLYSYHINVGHGNHSLIVFNSNNKFHIWMVDCSDYDFVSHRYYQDNIKTCIEHLQNKFGLEQVHIEAIMLTHPHYDHYSGIGYYIDNGMINKESIFYINLKYNINSHNFNNLLTKIATLGSPIIEPFSCNSCVNIKILYPDKLTFTNNNLTLNNKSSVYNICFDDVSYFVFPGDLETKGWNLMNPIACSQNMRNTHYYAISHHGSLNGHLRNFYCNQRRRMITNIKDCLSPSAITVLMGRDKAFSKIYSDIVINDFKDRILYSEKDTTQRPANFLEIDLLTSTHKWY